jgi:uncharacterized membrane protein
MKTALVAVGVVAVVLLLALAYSTELPRTSVASPRNDVVQVCGREFVSPVGHNRTFVKGMRLDCGIYGPGVAGGGD